MCIGWPTIAMPKPSFLSERVFSGSMVVMWWPVLMWLVAGWDPKFCGWLWDDARWGNVVGCEMLCHVMWSDVISFDVMRFLVLCDVTWCTAMLCDVLSCDELSSVVKWCGAEFVMRCGWLRCHVVWFEVVVWGELENDLVMCTTQIYSVLQSTTPILFYITKYYCRTTLTNWLTN